MTDASFVTREGDDFIGVRAAEQIARAPCGALDENFDGAAELAAVDLRLDRAMQIDEPLEPPLRFCVWNELFSRQARRRRALATER